MILITGGLGFLGGNLAKYLLDHGCEVLLTRNRNAQIPELLAPYLGKGLAVAPLDVTNITTILEAIRKHGVKSIIHGASIYEGKGSLQQAVDVNVNGTGNILEAARLMELGRVTFVSSEGVNQGRKGHEPLKEEEFFWVRSDRYIPVTKKMAELLCLMYRQTHKLDVVITRPSRIYGPLYAAGRNPILRMVTAAVKGGATAFADINGSEGHDFVYVRDCARAHVLIHCAHQTRHDIYNIGLGQHHTFGEVARALEKLCAGVKLQLGEGVGTITKTEFDIDACLDNSRMEAEFGYRPEYDLEKGLAALAAWVKDGSYL
jgi:nucleoside-diphosphate-sugar epimerase